ncbi:MAG: DUF3750 domain-containing protein [Candidatus Moraniibacteriota bacterium]
MNNLLQKKTGYESRIDPEKHQVFLFRCPVTMPLHFASHPWFVCNERGTVTRWEVLDRRSEESPDRAYLHVNHFPTWSGIEILPFIRKEPLWKGKLLGKVEGDRAKEMIDFIKTSGERYPYRDRYSLIGINSNTYAQWVLDHFEDVDLKLPHNSFGKNAVKRSRMVRRAQATVRRRIRKLKKQAQAGLSFGR